MPEPVIEPIRRAFAVLQALNRRRSTTLAVLAAETGLPGPTVVRLLHTLIALGYASRVSREAGYRLTDQVLLLAGGVRLTDGVLAKGAYVAPTVFTDCDDSMEIVQEEIFGPVLSIIRFKDEAEAVAIANDVRFGLAAAVWTSDIGRAVRMSEKLQAGTVWVNTYRAVSFMAPFGGYKDSGLGLWINSGAVAGNPFVMR